MTHEKKARLFGVIGSRVARSITATLRFRLEDRASVVGRQDDRPLIWAFWHNRFFVVPCLFQRYFGGRWGAALTSASKDGEVLAAFLKCFNIRTVRGSSSRGGARALVEMKRVIERGGMIAITPDGPRGPRYHLNPGIVKLAQITRGWIMPVHITYSRFWQLRSWDGFMIPQPFAKVRVVFDRLIDVPQTNEDGEFERQRAKIEELLRPAGAAEK